MRVAGSIEGLCDWLLDVMTGERMRVSLFDSSQMGFKAELMFGFRPPRNMVELRFIVCATWVAD